jgi:hypothetical protein
LQNGQHDVCQFGRLGAEEVADDEMLHGGESLAQRCGIRCADGRIRAHDEEAVHRVAGGRQNLRRR